MNQVQDTLTSCQCPLDGSQTEYLSLIALSSGFNRFLSVSYSGLHIRFNLYPFNENDAADGGFEFKEQSHKNVLSRLVDCFNLPSS